MGEPNMKKLALAIIAVLALATMAGCVTPPPVVTKG
jgi:predicted small lipoprotein YifL